MNDAEKEAYRESHARSILKAVSWRIVAAVDTFIICYIVTGKISFASSIMGLEVLTKMVIYYLHERAWQMLPRGRIRMLLNDFKVRFSRSGRVPVSVHLVQKEVKENGS